MSLLTYATFLIVLAPVLHWLSKMGQRPPDYPPGPPTIPIFGNLLQMPNCGNHLYLNQLKHKYGRIFSLCMGPRKVTIVLSDPQDIKELLDLRGSIYSSRPDMRMANTASGELRMLLKVGTILKWSFQIQDLHIP